MSLAHVVHEFGDGTKRLPMGDTLPAEIDYLGIGFSNVNNNTTNLHSSYNSSSKNLLLRCQYITILPSWKVGYRKLCLIIQSGGVTSFRSLTVSYTYGGLQFQYTTDEKDSYFITLTERDTLELFTTIQKPTLVRFDFELVNNARYSLHFLFDPTQ